MSLKRTVFSAGRWTATSAAARIFLQLLQTVVLARLLLPADFGLMAVAASLIAVASLFADVGVSRALVHFDDVSTDALSSLYWLNLACAFALMLLMFLSAPFIGSLYKSSNLVPLLQMASLIFPLSAAGQQFRAIAEKELRFSALAGNEIAAALLGFSIAVSVAVGGGGVYALVTGALASAASSSVLAWWRLSEGRRPSLRFRIADTKRYLTFGTDLVAGNLANTILRQADVFVAGIALGPTAIGLYTLPRDLSLKLAMGVNPIITRVGFPVMARARHDRAVLKSIYLLTLRMSASVNFPIYIALAVFADDVVTVVFGPHFYGAGGYLRILALWGLLRSIGNPAGSLLHAVGATRRALFWTLGNLLVLPPTYWLAAHIGGLDGLAWSLLVLQAVIQVPAWRLLVRPYCGARFGEFFSQVGTPLMIAAVAGAAGLLSTHWLDGPVLRLGVGGLTGAIVYLLLSGRFNRRWLDAMMELMLPDKPLWLSKTQRKTRA